MLDNKMRVLIVEEQKRSKGKLIPGDIVSYIDKIDEHAEIISLSAGEHCRGFVAYYCNDYYSRIAYITLVLVNPADRGMSLGKRLVKFALKDIEWREYDICQLEVDVENDVAYSMYLDLGFYVKEDRGTKHLMEVQL